MLEEDTNFNIEVKNTKYSFFPFSLIAVTLDVGRPPPTEVPGPDSDPDSKSTKRICVRCHPDGSSGRMLPGFRGMNHGGSCRHDRISVTMRLGMCKAKLYHTGDGRESCVCSVLYLDL